MCALIHWPIRDEFAKFHTGMTVKENNEKKDWTLTADSVHLQWQIDCE